MKRIRRPGTGNLILIDERTGRVFKRVKNVRLLRNEQAWLRILKDFERSPSLIEVTKNQLIMEYVGEAINSSNLPQDWEAQALFILEGLKKYNCYHNDIRLSNLRIKNNKLYLIDFGEAYIKPRGPYRGDQKRFFSCLRGIALNVK